MSSIELQSATSPHANMMFLPEIRLGGGGVVCGGGGTLGSDDICCYRLTV